MGPGSKAGARAAAVVGAGAGATTQKGCCRHSSRKKRRLAVLFAAVLPIVSGFVPQLPRPRLGLLPSFPASSDGQRRAVSVHTSTRPTRRVLRLSSADDHGSSSEPASASAGATAVLEEEEEEGGRGSGSDKNKTKGGGKVAVAQAVVATVGASVINAAAASAKPVGALVNKVRSNPLSRPKQEKVDEAGKVVINWEEKEPFNLETAVLLAGFAFESYLDPADSKWSLGRDGTKVAFRDDEFVTEVFKGLLCVTVHSAENLPKQSGFAETVLSGAGVDTYADLRIENDAGCLDSTLEAQQSHVVRDRSTPRYGEMFQLYVGDATKATLNITIIDQELFGPDVPLGTVSFPVQTFAQEGMVEDGAPKAWEDWAVLTPCSQEVARRVEIGGRGPMRVRMDVMYVPFGPRDDPLSAAEAALREAEEEGEEEEEERAEREREEEEAEEEEERKRLENLARFITGPRGATDGVDWRVLAQKVGGFATVAKDFTPTFFLEQDDTDTQVDVWRDRSTKRLVISFRGTESIKWRDFVTDANFLQVPYDDEEGAVFSDKIKSKVESAKRQVGGGGGKKERRGLSALLPRLLPGRRRRREDEEAAAAAEEAAAVAAAAASATEAAAARAVAEEAAVGGITDQMAEVLTGLEKLRSDIPASVREGLAVVPGVTQSLNQISSNLDVLKRVALTASTTDEEDGEEREKEEEEEGEEEGGASVGGRGEEGGGGDEGGGGGGGDGGEEGESWDTKAVGSKRIKSSSSNSRDEKAERKRLQSLRLSAQVKQREEQQKNVLGDWAGLIQESLASSVYDWVKSTRAFEPSSTHHEHGEGDEDGEGEGEGEGAQRGQAEGRRRRRSKQQQQEQQLRIPDTPMQSFQRFVNSSIEDLKKESMAANGGGGGFNFSFDMQDFLVSSGLDVAAMPPIMANLTALGQAGSNITTLEQFTNMFASVLSDSIPKSVGQQALVQGQGQGGGLDDLLEELRAAGKAASDDSVQSFLSSLADLVQMSSLKESVPLVHTGFKSAYDSTQETLRGMVETAVEGDIEGYHILVTGHSLGGALAVLASLDIKRRHPEAWVTCYSFGAPRAGNTAFANVVNANLDEYFRVVNDKDIIPRMPRGRVVMRALDYEHGGRTVLVDEDNQGSLWIEGESEGMDQLKDLDPSVMLLESISRNIDGKEQEGYQLVIQDQDAQEGQEGQHTTEEDDQHSSPQEEQGGFLSMMKREGEGKGQEKEGKRQEEGEDEEGKATKSTSMTKAESNDVTDHKHDKVEPIPTTMASALSFLDRELLLLDALLSGEAFAHHFEADYFKALDLAAGVPLNRRRRKRGDRVRNMLSKGKGGAAGRAREKDKKEKEKEEKDKKAKEKKEKKEKGVGASSGGRPGDDDYSDDSGLLWVVAKQLKTRGEKAAADFSGAWPKE